VNAGRFAAAFLCLWVTWIALTASLHPQELFVGGIASLLVAALSCKFLFHRGIGEKLHLSRLVHGIAYIPAYAWAEVKAHLKVIYLILHPHMPIKPGIVRVPTRLRTDFGITGLADAITMTPGTLSVEVDEEKPSLYVHWIDVATTDPKQVSERIARPFERYLRRIFG
jgi:multicomponent Na+:H+ antiporter subunit E